MMLSNGHHHQQQQVPGSDTSNTSPLSSLSSSSSSPHHQVVAIRNIIKRRRRLTASEQSCLQRVFDVCQKPSPIIRDRLAERLNMSKRCIQIWFQNRRAKLKRDQADAKQPPLLFKATNSVQEEEPLEESEFSETAFDEQQLESLLSDCSTLTNTIKTDNDWLCSTIQPQDHHDQHLIPIINPSILEANIQVLEQQQQQFAGTPADLFELYLTM